MTLRFQLTISRLINGPKDNTFVIVNTILLSGTQKKYQSVVDI